MSTRIQLAAAFAFMLSGGLAGAALFAQPDPPAPVKAAAATRPEVRTQVIRQVVHRVRREQPRHVRRRSVPVHAPRPAAAVPRPAPAAAPPPPAARRLTRISGGASGDDDDRGESDREHEDGYEAGDD